MDHIKNRVRRFSLGRQSISVALRQTTRRLELRSFSLMPEYFNGEEGRRAAISVAVPLAVAVFSQRPDLGWAVFAAFWTCLCDVSGPHYLRKRLLSIFVICGTFIALVGSWLASLAPDLGMIAGPVLVFLILFGIAFILFSEPLGTILSVVAVVAVGFPHSLEAAFTQAIVFFAGSSWAYLLTNHLWRIDPALPLHRSSQAVAVRLLDMAEYLSELGVRHYDKQWHSERYELFLNSSIWI